MTPTEPDNWQPCLACRAPITMIAHEKSGKPAPLLRPREGGMAPNITVRFEDGRWVYHVINKKEREAGVKGEYLNHWADCPNAHLVRRASPNGGDNNA